MCGFVLQNDPSLMLLMLLLRAPETLYQNEAGVDLDDYEVSRLFPRNRHTVHSTVCSVCVLLSFCALVCCFLCVKGPWHPPTRID